MSTPEDRVLAKALELRATLPHVPLRELLTTQGPERWGDMIYIESVKRRLMQEGMDAATIVQALRALDRAGKIMLQEQTYLNMLTPEQRKAGIDFGGRDMHLIQFND
jgi:hypothetical protein